jgi:hypothetical protein
LHRDRGTKGKGEGKRALRHRASGS